MMNRALRPSLALLTLLTLAAVAMAASPEKQPPSYSTEVNIQPGAVGGTYVVKIKVKNSPTGEIMAGSSLKVAAGQPVTAESTLEGSDTVVHMDAKVAGTHGVSYSVTVKAGGQTLSEHTANIQL